MNMLPQELICNVCSHLEAEDLRNASFVSTRFRAAAEDCSNALRHRFIRDPTTENFRQQYSGFRHRYISHVEFRIHVLSGDPERSCRREWVREQLDRDSFFTNQVRDLFVALKHVEIQAGPRNPGRYHLNIICEERYVPPDGCPHRDHARWRTHLLDHMALPCLPSVRSLELRNVEAGLKLDYRVLIDLMTRFPNIEDVALHTGRDEWTPYYEDEPAQWFPWDYAGLRRDTRHEFSKAVEAFTVPSTLARVNLNFLCRRSMGEWDLLHQWRSQPDLVSPASADPFSTSLHILSYNLRELTIRAQIDETFFWPKENSTPRWPHLERLFIMFHIVAPSGSWYFEGPRGEGRGIRGFRLNEDSYPSDDEEETGCSSDEFDRSFEHYDYCCFRVSPNIEVLRPLLMGFANAAVNMPKLKQAILWAPLRWDPDGADDHDSSMFDYIHESALDYATECAWGVGYDYPGELPMLKIGDGWRERYIRHLWWEVGNWRPDAALAETFHEIGRAEHGDKLKETYGYGEDSFGLADRYWIEEFTQSEDSLS